MQRFSPKAFSVLEKKIFNGFYYIWAWRPSWSTDRNHFSNLSFPQPKKAPYEIWAKLVQGLHRRSRLKMLTDGRTDRRADDGRKVITIAHLEQSSGELNMFTPVNPFFLYMAKKKEWKKERKLTERKKEGRQEGHTASRNWILQVHTVLKFIQSKMR